ncbi:MAG: TrbI/VirB10 family protein [Rickettsiales bacterium]|nr:TrbI/VirB10 family protein [Rickettsiales bacterium]MCA0253961.1 hypothetical protein [Pseudomonadota bacterium]
MSDEPVQTPNNNTPEAEASSQVASDPKKSILILVGIGAVFIYLVYSLFFASDTGNKGQESAPIPDQVTKPVQVSSDTDIPSIPTLPSPPKLEDPTPPPPPPSDSAEALPVTTEALPTTTAQGGLPPLPTATNEATLPDVPSLPVSRVKDDEAQKRLEAKRKSAIVLIAGTQPAKTPEQIQQEADFTKRGDMNFVLGRGKLIDAILETAVNTDFGGEVRAIITRDVYSEWGRNILIPKGSRVFGNYATGTSGAYGRIGIEWTRIDLVSGYSINLSGSGVDNLGRKGLQGRVDNKFSERFSNAVLRSVFNVALAKAVDSLVKPPSTSQAAANRNADASNIQNIANGIFSQPATAGVTDDQKRVQICANVLSAIQDKTSSTFTQIQTACNNLAADATSTPTAKLTSLMSTIVTASNGLIQNTAQNVESTKAQDASKQAFTDLSDTIKSFVEEQQFKPTITIDQGTPMRIYVNKDYKFPKAAVSKTRAAR